MLNLLHLLYILWGRKEEGKGWKFPVGSLTLWLTQQFIFSPSVKFLNCIHIQLWVLWLLRWIVSCFFLYSQGVMCTWQTGRIHQYHLASCGSGKSFYTCNSSGDKENARKRPFKLIGAITDTWCAWAKQKYVFKSYRSEKWSHLYSSWSTTAHRRSNTCTLPSPSINEKGK